MEMLIITDRRPRRDHLLVHALLATGAVHRHLVKLGLRCASNLIVETGTARDPRINGSILVQRGTFRMQGTRAKFTRTNGTVEFAVLDGPVATSGSQGLRAAMAITNFSRSEPLEEAIKVSVTAKPTYSDHPPEWMVTT
ncbi:MAG: hypothetical protein HC794_06785 [Nitrospiraceae bacterium]|nr:hypothetical protein [Nitrospiraceae bacterium]